MRSTLIAGCLILMLLSATLALQSDAATSMIDASIYTKQGERIVRLEAAITPEIREQGLMHRDTLAPADGMLFVFPQAADHKFWMKNTHIPLDMLFVSVDNVIVDIKANVPPHTLTHRHCGQPVIAVIELDGGRAARESIAPGDRVRYVLPAGAVVY